MKHAGGQPGNRNAFKWTEEKAVQIMKDFIIWMEPKIEMVYCDYAREEKEKDVHKHNDRLSIFLKSQNLTISTINYLRTKYPSFVTEYERARIIQKSK